MTEREGKRSFSLGHYKWLGFAACLAAGLGLITLFLVVEVSSQPRFCGSCHVMEPYYESWKHSSHREIACVECHIPPGVAQEVRKKYEALSMVVSYFTGTYGTNPWAEVDDASCLRCHERRLLAGKELFGDVIFNHGPHLSELRRGKRLRCTSCHSQIVQGQHIAVTPSTCILCHFKRDSDAPPDSSPLDTSRCTLCHNIPEKVVEKGLVRFDHSDVKKFDMECRWCHSREAFGSVGGEVPRERCFTCHNDKARLDRYSETDLMHRQHVSEHKIDCLNCHLEIKHGNGATEAHKNDSPSPSGCEACHKGGHSPQRDLYTGLGGRGVEPLPAAMYSAGVACEGCHLEIPGHERETATANEVSCMSCHGPRYRSVFFRWKAGVEERTRLVRRELQATAGLFSESEPQTLMDARHNLELVERGRGVHNVPFAYALLNKSHDWINDARRQRKAAPFPVPWARIPYETPCARCHEGIENQSGTAFGRAFEHRVHVSVQKLECGNCHRTHEEKNLGEALRFSSAGCESCHHKEPRKACLQCHSGILKRDVASFRGEFSHSLHVDMDLACEGCHKIEIDRSVVLNREICADCHED